MTAACKAAVSHFRRLKRGPADPAGPRCGRCRPLPSYLGGFRHLQLARGSQLVRFVEHWFGARCRRHRMNIKALITTLVLGSSTLAVVAPTLASADVRDHRTEEVSPSIRDHRTEYAPPVAAQVQLQARADWHRPMQRPVFVPAPVTLASSTKLSGRDVIRVSNTRAFTKLELKSNGGRTKLDKVMIQFGNGQMQT